MLLQHKSTFLQEIIYGNDDKKKGRTADGTKSTGPKGPKG